MLKKEVNNIECSIDEIGLLSFDKETLTIFFSDRLTIRGWAYCKDNSRIINEVFVEIYGNRFKAKYGTERKDVKNEKNITLVNIGFELTIPKDSIQEGNSLLKIGVHTNSDENFQDIFLIPVNLIGSKLWNEDYESILTSLSGEIKKRESTIQLLEKDITQTRQSIKDIKASLSWRLTLPVRKIVSFIMIYRTAFSIETFNLGLSVLREKGLGGLVEEIILFYKRRSDNTSTGHALKALDYKKFVEDNRLTDNDFTTISAAISRFKEHPLISIVVPVYNVSPFWLNKCIESVFNQVYSNWELCLYDDASDNKETVDCLNSWKNRDSRIKVIFAKTNRGIAIATNEAIKNATGLYVGFLDNDDELTQDALYEVVTLVNKSLPDFIYCDEDKLEINGELSSPYFKPDFSIDHIRSNNFMCHFAVVKKEIGDRVGWLREGFEGSQDYDFILRVVDETSKIYHIPKVLYHWRKIPGSTADDYYAKNYAFESGKRALEEHLKRNQIKGSVVAGLWGGAYKISYDITNNDLISIVIPFKDKATLLKTCVESILGKTTYKNYEILLVSNNSVEQETFEYIQTLVDTNDHIKLLEHNVPFNFSEINNWATQFAMGNYFLFLNNDIEIITGDWLSSMVEHIQRNEIGAVGARLLYPDNRIQHDGVVLGIGGVAGHAFKYLPSDRFDFHNTMGLIRNVSACTGACLLVKKTVFEQVGKFDSDNLTVAFNDIDLCLKITKAGYLITYTPYATLYHHESISRGNEDSPEKQARFKKEVSFMTKKWETKLATDPYYNPNLTLEREDFSLIQKPRS